MTYNQAPFLNISPQGDRISGCFCDKVSRTVSYSHIYLSWSCHPLLRFYRNKWNYIYTDCRKTQVVVIMCVMCKIMASQPNHLRHACPTYPSAFCWHINYTSCQPNVLTLRFEIDLGFCSGEMVEMVRIHLSEFRVPNVKAIFAV